MAYENAKRILRDDEMRVEQNDQSIYDDGVVIGFWEGVESKHLEECIEWLNHADNDEVAADVAFFDISFGTKLYHLHARFSEKDQRIYRILSKELNSDVSAPITAADTRWRIKSGGNHRGSNDVQILELPYCDPLVIEEIVKAHTELTYTNSINTINGGVLSGTWHNIKTIFEVDEQSGRAKALWFLSKQANDDLHFAYYRNPNTFVVDFFKFDASETGLASLETDYFFDDKGNWYIAADQANYTQKNGVDTASTPLSGEPEYGESLGSLRDAIDGRMAHPVEITRSETTRFYQAHAHMEFFDELSAGNSVSYGTPLVTVTETIVEGAASLPSTAGTAEYNLEGTKETSTNIVSPQRDPIKGTWSYIIQVIEKWAPHASQETDTDTITVTGTGTIADTTYTLEATLENGHKWWSYGGSSTDKIFFNSTLNSWVIVWETDLSAAWELYGDTELPPKTGWSISAVPINHYPAPSLFYAIEGEVGYVEGPSEIRTKTESLALARGIGSGYASLGGWGGGGKGRIRINEGDNNASLVAKEFRPYNIALARRCTVRTTSRFYYYVKEPGINQYPSMSLNQYPGSPWNETIEDKHESDLASSAPRLVSSTVTDGTKFVSGGKLVTHVYSDGVFTLVCYESDDTIKFIRTYPASGNGGAYFYSVYDGTVAKLRLSPNAEPTDQSIVAGATITIDSGIYEGTHTITSVEQNANDNNHWSVVIDATYAGDSSGGIYGPYGSVLVDEAGLNADPGGTLTDDDGLYMGHYILEDYDEAGEHNFYTEGIRHRILKVAESVYALVIETNERTIWKMDEENKWILNAEEVDVGYARPPSSPSLAGTIDANVPFVM